MLVSTPLFITMEKNVVYINECRNPAHKKANLFYIFSTSNYFMLKNDLTGDYFIDDDHIF